LAEKHGVEVRERTADFNLINIKGFAQIAFSNLFFCTKLQLTKICAVHSNIITPIRCGRCDHMFCMRGLCFNRRAGEIKTGEVIGVQNRVNMNSSHAFASSAWIFCTG